MASFFLVLVTLLLPSPEPPPAVLHGGRAAPRAWLAVDRGALWLCWDDGARRGAPDPDCWQRVELPTAVDPRELRAVFLDAGTALVRDADERTLQITRGDVAAHPADVAAQDVLPGERPTPLACGPTGHVPIVMQGRWAWRAAPCSAGAGTCVAAPALPRLRRPIGFALFLAVEARTGERSVAELGARTIAGAEIVAAIGGAFDPAGWFGQRLAWQELQAARRPQARALPELRSTGPLAAREREALAAAVCGGQVR